MPRTLRPKAAHSRAAAEFTEPMKALGVGSIPSAGEWHSEIKFDGYRAIAVLADGAATLWSRNHKPMNYPEVIPALEALRCSTAVLDGEIVALDEKGRSNFQILQGRDLGERPVIVFYLFDLLSLDGRSLLGQPIEARRAALKKLIGRPSKALHISPWFEAGPEALLAETKRLGLEGIVIKRHASTYEPGRRSGAWLKVKNVNEQEFVVGGFTPPKNSREFFGSILVGHYLRGKLVYAGKVGTGFDRALLRSLHERFVPLAIKECPFSNLPLDHHSRFGQGMTRSVMRTVTWLRPKLVAQVKFAEWTQEGILRQPVFLGLRNDKAAKETRREAAAV